MTRRRWAQDDGMTLPELLVAAVVSMVIVLATGSIFVAATRGDAGTRGRTEDTDAAQYALRVVSRTVPYAVVPDMFIRTLDSPVLLAEPDALAFVMTTDDGTPGRGGPYTLVEMRLADGVLTETSISTTGVSSASELRSMVPLAPVCEVVGSCSTRTLADGLLPGSGLAYLTSSGAPATQASEVASIDLTLVVETDPARQDVPSTHVQRIYLKNRS